MGGEPGARMARRGRGDAHGVRRLLRLGRDGREPVGPGRRPPRRERCSWRRTPTALADRLRRHGAFVGRIGGAGHGRRPALRLTRRTRPPHRPRARGGARSHRPGWSVRGGRERRLDQRRNDRRPRGHRGRLPRTRALDARRRRVRRCRTPRAERPRPVPRHRAGRLVHRRPAQVAVRAVRLLRAHLSRAREGAGGSSPGRLVPRRPERHLRMEPQRLRAPPLPASARAPPVVLARDLRHGRLSGRGRAGPVDHAGDGRGDPPSTRTRARPGTRAVRGPVRRLGWEPHEYEAWWRTALTQQVGFVQPTSWEGEKVGRLCFVNPRTTIEHVRAILDLAA